MIKVNLSSPKIILAIITLILLISTSSAKKCKPDKIQKALQSCSFLPCSTICSMACSSYQLKSSLSAHHVIESKKCKPEKIRKELLACKSLSCFTLCNTLCSGQGKEEKVVLEQWPEKPSPPLIASK